MSRLRDRMIEDLRLRGRAQNTIDAYVRCVRKLVEWAEVPPSGIDAERVRAFVLHLMDDRHLSCSSQDVYVGAIKFFFRVSELRRLGPDRRAARRLAIIAPDPDGNRRAPLPRLRTADPGPLASTRVAWTTAFGGGMNGMIHPPLRGSPIGGDDHLRPRARHTASHISVWLLRDSSRGLLHRYCVLLPSLDPPRCALGAPGPLPLCA